MIPENVAITEIVRLYRAAGEPTPEILSSACQPVGYPAELPEYWSETQ